MTRWRCQADQYGGFFNLGYEGRVVVLSPQGAIVRIIPNDKTYQLSEYVISVDVDSAGNVYIVQQSSINGGNEGEIAVFSPAGEFLLSLPPVNDDNDQYQYQYSQSDPTYYFFDQPYGLTLDNNNNMLLADWYNSRIAVIAGLTVNPDVTAISSSAGSTANTVSVILSGVNFGTQLSLVTVLVGSVPCIPTSVTTRSIVCTLPAGHGAYEPVLVVVNGTSSSNTSTVTLTYGPPTLQSISPGLFAVPGGTVVTLSGFNFGPGLTGQYSLTVNSAPVVVTSYSQTQVVFIAPQGGPQGETALVQLMVGGRASNAVTATYIDLPPPQLFSVTQTGVGSVSLSLYDALPVYPSTGSLFIYASSDVALTTPLNGASGSSFTPSHTVSYPATGETSVLSVPAGSTFAQYIFAVVVSNAVGVSPVNSVVFSVVAAPVTPAAPTISQVSATAVALTMSAIPSPASGTVTIMYYSSTSGLSGSYGVGGAAQSTVDIGGLAVGDTVHAYVTVRNAAGHLTSSTSALPLQTAPSAPAAATTSFSASPAPSSTATITLSFSSVASATAYHVYLEGHAGSLSVPQPSPLTASVTINITSLALGLTYAYYVTAVNAWGESAPLFFPTLTPLGPPGAASNPTATSYQPSSTSVSWQIPPAQPSAYPVTSYSVQCTGADGSTTAAVMVAATASVAAVTGLTNGLSYTCQVGAVAGQAAAVLSALTPSFTPAAAPSAPLTVTAVSAAGTTSVSWAAPNTTGGAPMLSYTISCLPTGAAAGQICSPITGVSSSLTSATVPGLASGAVYLFQVQAVNAAGTGPAGVAAAAVQTLGLPSNSPLVSLQQSGATTVQVVAALQDVSVASTGGDDVSRLSCTFTCSAGVVTPASKTVSLSAANSSCVASYTLLSGTTSLSCTAAIANSLGSSPVSGQGAPLSIITAASPLDSLTLQPIGGAVDRFAVMVTAPVSLSASAPISSITIQASSSGHPSQSLSLPYSPLQSLYVAELTLTGTSTGVSWTVSAFTATVNVWYTSSATPVTATVSTYTNTGAPTLAPSQSTAGRLTLQLSSSVADIATFTVNYTSFASPAVQTLVIPASTTGSAGSSATYTFIPVGLPHKATPSPLSPARQTKGLWCPPPARLCRTSSLSCRPLWRSATRSS